MSEPIKVGDLVVVIRAGCMDANVGFVFTVTRIQEYDGAVCASCKKHHGTGRKVYHDDQPAQTKGRWFSESRLKRIPPLSELEGEKRYVKIPA